MKKLLSIWLLFFVLLEAENETFEFGIGIGSLYYPNYVGSKSTQTLTLPLPYIRYRGEYIRIDEDGLTGKLFGINGLHIDLSVSGSLPASSQKDGAREGMPDLDLTGETGPKLVYNIYEEGVSKLEFELDVRATLSTDFKSISYRGFLSNPQIKYSLNYSTFEWTLRTGLVFSDKTYNNYYYGVDKQYQTSKREIYDAKSGYGGFRNRIGMTYKKENMWAGAFISYINIKQSIFENSPLVETQESLYIGASLAYILYSVK